MQNNVPPTDVEHSTFLQKIISPPGQLEELALTLAKNLRLFPPGQHCPSSRGLKTLGIFLRAAYRYFKKSTQTETSVSHTAELLLDNFDIIQGAPSP